MIRLACISDKERVIELLAEAHPQSIMSQFVAFSPEMAAANFLFHMSSPDSLCLVHDVGDVAQGVFVAIASDYPSAPIRIGIEVVSWVSRGHRGHAWFEMKRQFEQWSKSKGCKVTSLSSKSDERFSKAISRSGYRPIETHYVKVL